MTGKELRRLAVLTVAPLVMAACSDSTSPEPTIPSAPTNVQAAVSGDTITVTWSPSTGATSHRVEVSAPGQTTQTETVGAGDAEAVFGGLADGVTYNIQVFAINTAGENGSAVVTAEIVSNLVLITDDILSDQTWTSDRIYKLRGPIFVGKDMGADPANPKSDGIAVTLTIEPGTTILGDVDPLASARGSYLVISRGSKIVADANANEADRSVRPDPANVIVFTSSAPRGQRQRGDWGGLVINGRAPTNAGLEAQGEGDSGLYGGTDEDDDSGILRGVRIEFAGDRVTATDELNGLAPQGVGAGTTIDYVQIHYNVDDGTEPFGGTVSMTHVVTTGIGDDSFDGTDGYKGFMQFLIAQQRGDDADQGFELSNNGDAENASPHSTAVMANATLIGARNTVVSGDIAGAKSDNGILLREGSNYRIFNTIVTGFGKAGFCVEGDQAAANADARLAGGTDPDATLRVESSILYNNKDSADADANFDGDCGGPYTLAQNKTFFMDASFNNMVADPGLPTSAFDKGTMSSPPDFAPSAMPAGYTAFDASTLNGGAGLVMPTDGRTLVATDYAGAVAPGTALTDAWYYGWTVWASDGSDSRPNENGQ